MSEKLIYKKLLDIQDEIEAIHKNKSGQGLNYKFRGVEDILDEVAPALRKHRVIVSPSVHNKTYNKEKIEKFNANGQKIGERFDTSCTFDMVYTFTTEDGSYHVVGPIPCEGMDMSDKATPKALSQAYKMAMIQTFAIPVNDMPETEKDDGKNSKRDMPEISVPDSSKPIKDQINEKNAIIEKIRLKMSEDTVKMDKTQKLTYMENKLRIKNFNDLADKKIEELDFLYDCLLKMSNG